MFALRQTPNGATVVPECLHAERLNMSMLLDRDGVDCLVVICVNTSVHLCNNYVPCSRHRTVTHATMHAPTSIVRASNQNRRASLAVCCSRALHDNVSFCQILFSSESHQLQCGWSDIGHVVPRTMQPCGLVQSLS